MTNLDKKYRIYTGGTFCGAETVLTALFKKGYVFNRTYRIRTFDKVLERWYVDGWNWILIGFDPDCKAVLGFSVYLNDDFERITLEEFLKLK